MNDQLYIFTAVLFLTGLLLGSIVSFFVFKYTLNKRLKDFHNFLKSVSEFQKLKIAMDKKKASTLILLNEKFKELNKEIKNAKTPDYDNYLKDLNSILNQLGIKDVDIDENPDSE